MKNATMIVVSIVVAVVVGLVGYALYSSSASASDDNKLSASPDTDAYGNPKRPTSGVALSNAQKDPDYVYVGPIRLWQKGWPFNG